ncbi:MAG TPA: hormogonium polysaccharide secretion pseudopilin HpsC [Waterburya sp.]|jgi:type II secretory pathway component PulJ
MLKLLKFLLTYQFKNSRSHQKNGGFTLIELLVGLVMAFLVIIPLLGFMVNMLQTDRQEQAKANTEQEVQAALSYIARDAEQAVYFYDKAGLDAIKAELPKASDSNYVPVLVFWKRQFIRNIIPTGTVNSCQTDADKQQCNDAFVYSLVTYYITKSDPTTCARDAWSCTAQIRRVEIRDAVKGKDNQPISSDEKVQASPGFQLFTVGQSPDVKTIMNTWKKGAGNIDSNVPEVLIDYIDKTPVSTTDPTQLCPPPMELVPSTASLANLSSGFYACVNVKETTAQVFMRGNALARLRQKANPPSYVDRESVASYFPKASIQVKGRGLFNVVPTDQ